VPTQAEIDYFQRTPRHIIGGVLGKEDDHVHDDFQSSNIKDTPTDPRSIEGFELYWKKIDDNNNGLFIKGKKGGVMIEGQIF
jgi:hypothetical protein